MLLLRLAVHPGNRTARKDVVELQQQHRLPRTLQFFVRVRDPVPHGCGRGPVLGLPQEVLVAPIALFRAQLRGEHPAVQLEVELSRPDGSIRILGLRLREERFGRVDVHSWRSFERGEPVGCGDHLAGRPSPAVAPAERYERHGRAALLREVLFSVREFGTAQLRHVRVRGRKVGEYPRAVDAFPPEGVVRHPVHLVPADLLGEEPALPRRGDDLRQRGGVSERVGQPRLPALNTELGRGRNVCRR